MTTIDHDALIAFTQELVRIPSVHDPDRGLNEEKAAVAVAEQMRAFGWEPTMELVEPGRPNVIAVVDGDAPGPTLMFEGHTDVVTEGDGWTVDPFGAEIRGGRLYGRGSADMKAGLAAMLFATDAVVRSGSFPGRIVLAALVDEEGMMAGAKHLVANGHLDSVDGVICCEPEAGEICHVAKGALRLRVDVGGRMAHGAMPFQGRNPNRGVAAAIDVLADIEADLHERYGDHPYLGKVWVTPTVLRAGDPVQMNVMPARASMWVDVRTTPAVDHDELVADLTRRLAGATADHELTLTIEVIDDRPPVAVAEDDPLVRAIWDAHAAVSPVAPALGGVPGATDGTVLTSRTGVPSVVYGPGGKWIAHQADEFVELSDLTVHADVYVEAARRFLDRGR